MENLLLQQPNYQITETSFGTWKRFLYPTGRGYAEFTSHQRIGDWPLFHYTSGICPETGRRRVAKGVFAVGRVAIGLVALGQAAFGGIAIGQAALGLFLGVGQAAAGLFALGQLAIGGCCVGQVAIGAAAIGQFGVGLYVLAQHGFGEHIWDVHHADPIAKEFFHRLLPGK